MAYIKSVQERGLELTDEQKAIIAEFQEDEEILDARGLFVDDTFVLSARFFFTWRSSRVPSGFE